MENKRKPYKKSGQKFYRKPKEEPQVDRVVYRTKDDGPKRYADWQLKLKAIADTMDREVEDFDAAVELRYQELLRRQG